MIYHSSSGHCVSPIPSLLLLLACLLVSDRLDYFTEVCSLPSSRNVKPLGLLLMGARSWVCPQSSWGDVVLTGLCDIFSAGYTQLLNLTNCQLIAVLFSAMSWV